MFCLIHSNNVAARQYEHRWRCHMTWAYGINPFSAPHRSFCRRNACVLPTWALHPHYKICLHPYMITIILTVLLWLMIKHVLISILSIFGFLCLPSLLSVSGFYFQNWGHSQCDFFRILNLIAKTCLWVKGSDSDRVESFTYLIYTANVVEAAVFSKAVVLFLFFFHLFFRFRNNSWCVNIIPSKKRNKRNQFNSPLINWLFLHIESSTLFFKSQTGASPFSAVALPSSLVLIIFNEKQKYWRQGEGLFMVLTLFVAPARKALTEITPTVSFVSKCCRTYWFAPLQRFP